MKKNRGLANRISFSSIRLVFLLLLFGSLWIASCKKDQEPAPIPNDYLVSFDKVNNYSASFIKLLLGTMNAVYPGVDTLIADVKYGIDLYSITYKTTFKGTSITASGLVSVPSSSNQFPLLSFQNGTNTFRQNSPLGNLVVRCCWIGAWLDSAGTKPRRER